MDVATARLHRQLYNKLLDELDADIVELIMADPYGDEAQLLNSRVEKALQEAQATNQ